MLPTLFSRSTHSGRVAYLGQQRPPAALSFTLHYLTPIVAARQGLLKALSCRGGPCPGRSATQASTPPLGPPTEAAPKHASHRPTRLRPPQRTLSGSAPIYVSLELGRNPRNEVLISVSLGYSAYSMASSVYRPPHFVSTPPVASLMRRYFSPPCSPIVNRGRPYFLSPPPAFLIIFGRQGHAGQWPAALPLAADGLAKRSPNHAPTSSPNPALCSGFPMACGFALARCAALLSFAVHQGFKHKHRLVPRRASSLVVSLPWRCRHVPVPLCCQSLPSHVRPRVPLPRWSGPRFALAGSAGGGAISAPRLCQRGES